MTTIENVASPVVGESEMTMNCRQIAKKSTAKLALSAMKACESKKNMDSEGESESAEESDLEGTGDNKSTVNSLGEKNGVVRTARKTMKPSALADQQVVSMKEKQAKLMDNQLGLGSEQNGISSDNGTSDAGKTTEALNPVSECNGVHEDKSAKSDCPTGPKDSAETNDNNKEVESLELNDYDSDKPAPIIKNLNKIKLTLKSVGVDKKVDPVESATCGNIAQVVEEGARPATPNNRGNLFETFESKRSRPNTPNDSSRPCTPDTKPDKYDTGSEQTIMANETNSELPKETVKSENVNDVDVKTCENENKQSSTVEDNLQKNVPMASSDSIVDTKPASVTDTEGKLPASDSNVCTNDEANSEDKRTEKKEIEDKRIEEKRTEEKQIEEKTSALEVNHKVDAACEGKKTGTVLANETSEKTVPKETSTAPDKSSVSSASRRADLPMDTTDNDIICLSDSDDESSPVIKSKSSEPQMKIMYPSKHLTQKRPLTPSNNEHLAKRSRKEVVTGKLSVSSDDCMKPDNKLKKTITLTPEDLQNIIEKRLFHMVKKQTQALVTSFRNKIDELQKTSDKWKEEAKTLQKKIFELSIKHQQLSNTAGKRSIGQKNVAQRHVQIQCEAEMVKKITSAATATVVQKSTANVQKATATTISSNRSGTTSITIPSNLRPGTYLVSGNTIRQTAKLAEKTQQDAQTRAISTVIDLTQEEERNKRPVAAQRTNSTVKELINAKQKQVQLTTTLPNQRFVYVPPNPPGPPPANYISSSGMVTVVRAPGMTTAAPGVRTAMIQQPPNQVQRVQIIGQQITKQIMHPAPLPQVINRASTHLVLPKPDLQIKRVPQGIVLSWNMTISDKHPEIVNYQLFAYQETSAPASTSLWKKVGDVKALPLPMACTLTQFQEGNKYHFAVRAIDCHGCVGVFSSPASIHLMLNRRT